MWLFPFLTYSPTPTPGHAVGILCPASRHRRQAAHGGTTQNSKWQDNILRVTGGGGEQGEQQKPWGARGPARDGPSWAGRAATVASSGRLFSGARGRREARAHLHAARGRRRGTWEGGPKSVAGERPGGDCARAPAPRPPRRVLCSERGSPASPDRRQGAAPRGPAVRRWRPSCSVARLPPSRRRRRAVLPGLDGGRAGAGAAGALVTAAGWLQPGLPEARGAWRGGG